LQLVVPFLAQSRHGKIAKRLHGRKRLDDLERVCSDGLGMRIRFVDRWWPKVFVRALIELRNRRDLHDTHADVPCDFCRAAVQEERVTLTKSFKAVVANIQTHDQRYLLRRRGIGG
jgi:hypothetical protein